MFCNSAIAFGIRYNYGKLKHNITEITIYFSRMNLFMTGYLGLDAMFSLYSQSVTLFHGACTDVHHPQGALTLF